jgi:hypothetical protein
MSSVKTDRGYARTAQDIERKYAFGKTFADMLGLINDTRDDVDKVESSLTNEINEKTTTLMRDTENIVMQAKEELTSEVEMKLDADEVSIAIQQELANVDQVVTKTGYKFDIDGLNISRTGSEIENKIDHTGMYVSKNGDKVLTANNEGVKAKDLHATTYLKIGKNEGRSRFEDYGTNRTACFWIGG